MIIDHRSQLNGISDITFILNPPGEEKRSPALQFEQKLYIIQKKEGHPECNVKR